MATADAHASSSRAMFYSLVMYVQIYACVYVFHATSSDCEVSLQHSCMYRHVARARMTRMFDTVNRSCSMLNGCVTNYVFRWDPNTYICTCRHIRHKNSFKHAGMYNAKSHKHSHMKCKHVGILLNLALSAPWINCKLYYCNFISVCRAIIVVRCVVFFSVGISTVLNNKNSFTTKRSKY